MNRADVAADTITHLDPSGCARLATIRPIAYSDEGEFIALATESLEFHRRWIIAPKTPDEFCRYVARFENSDSAGFVICDASSQAIVGFANLNSIVGEPYQRGLLGYGIFLPYSSRGFMSAGLTSVIEHAFDRLSLHRLEADIQAENVASVRLVARLGFQRECVSKGFIRINGRWTDHERWVLIRETAG